jgi:tRNA(adenine34) deaminase
MLTDEYFMRIALAEAQKAYEEGEVPVGAVVVCNQQVIGKGYNQTKKQADATAHAEMLAITAATYHLGSRYLTGCTLYVTLEPCVMCGGATYWTQLQRIVYAAGDGKYGYSKISTAIIHPKTTITKGVLAQEAEALLSSFFQQLREKKM